jgi:hypothetical protein
MSFRKALEQRLYGLQADITIRLVWQRRVVAILHPTPTSASGSPHKNLLPLVIGGGMKTWMITTSQASF